MVEPGDVHSFGYGRDGHLGHGDEHNIRHLLPKLIVALQGKRAVQVVSAGMRHSLVLLNGARCTRLEKVPTDGSVTAMRRRIRCRS